MPENRKRPASVPAMNRLLVFWLAARTVFQGAAADAKRTQDASQDGWRVNSNHQTDAHCMFTKRGPPDDEEDGIPIHITNNCGETIWPGIETQSGTGPGTGGFEQAPGNTTRLWVSPEWQGRIWGRTNCTVSGESASCETGDCGQLLDCQAGGEPPATLAEFTLAGGTDGNQTFYDISLVDGYNLPLSINHIPSDNTTFIPPNLTNCACIATSGWLDGSAGTGTTYYSNDTYPIPWETDESDESVRSWCPWPNLVSPPEKPGHGIFPYPDDSIPRPPFSPCLSSCAATGKKEDCCAGEYDDAEKCKPARYSRRAKNVCPDAYSFAYDDDESTFIVPRGRGGGWEVVLCPAGRSTSILRQLGAELRELGAGGRLSEETVGRLQNVTYITMDKGDAGVVRPMVMTMMMVRWTSFALVIWLVL